VVSRESDAESRMASETDKRACGFAKEKEVPCEELQEQRPGCLRLCRRCSFLSRFRDSDRPISGGGGVVRPQVTVPGDPVIGDPVPTDAEQAAYDAADRITERKSQGVNQLNALRQHAVNALNAAAMQGAEFKELNKIAKQFEKQMRKVAKETTKDMKKLFKQGSKDIKAAGGTESNINYLAGRLSEDQGDLSAALTSRLSSIASVIENLLDLP